MTDLLDQITYDIFEDRTQPLPPQTYEASIREVKTESFPKDGEVYHALRITWDVTVPEDLVPVVGRRKATVRSTIFLNLMDDGRIDPKRNPQLGSLRKAVGQESGPWSIRNLVGASCLIDVSQRTADDGNTYNEARRFRPRPQF